MPYAGVRESWMGGGTNEGDEALTARVAVDGRGAVTGWNEGAARLLGYAPQEIVGRPATVLLAEEPASPDLPSLAAMPRWHGTLALRHRNGHRLEARLLAHPRTADDGSRGWLLVSAVAGGRPEPE